ncbi:hypothetical protein FYK55_01990 [Roseiconus nitratireducens]|uniref:Uncharacterized protein n=1 Tax=Roseiconus nitratireducens TaxID=2605748 RepID=A0A5M6DI17_9BACT|nr:hypothetical protein [Roseiconus nitratireducens]KAA5547197.1 hypothetical protein FYK55_01990 [Roseiconus nitratireducens]
MHFSMGTLELLLVLIAGAAALVLAARRDKRFRWAFAVFVCAAIAAAMTPPDLASMLLLFAAFLGCFTFGSTWKNPARSAERPVETPSSRSA